MTNSDDQSTPAVPPVPPAPGAPSEPAAATPPPASPYSPPPAYSAAPPTYTPADSTPYAVGGGSLEPKGLSIASMVTGIASVVFAFFFFGFLPGVAAVVLGHIAQRRQPAGRPFWLTGLITGYVGILIGLVQGAFLVFLIVAGINAGTGYSEYGY
jgi:hypothetical protein